MSAPNKLNLNYLLNDDMEDLRKRDEEVPRDEHGLRRYRRQDFSVGSASMSSMSIGRLESQARRTHQPSGPGRSSLVRSPSMKNLFPISTGIVSSKYDIPSSKDISEGGSSSKREKNRNFKCDLCGKSFFERGKFPYNFLFLILSKMSRFSFMLTHVTYSPLTYLKQEGNLNKHVSSVHMKEKPKICPEPGCGKSFSFRDGLMRHISHVHRNQRLYICNLCQKSFKQASHLGKHMRTIHKST